MDVSDTMAKTLGDLVLHSAFQEEEMNEKSQTIYGFDDEGGWDPTVTLHEDGNITIEFPEFPPNRIAEEGLEDDYDEVLAREFGTEICWEDREFFWILDPESPEEMFNKVVAFFQDQVEETSAEES